MSTQTRPIMQEQTPTILVVSTCIWCQSDLTESDLFIIPGSSIVLCSACFDRYNGEPPEPEE